MAWRRVGTVGVWNAERARVGRRTRPRGMRAVGLVLAAAAFLGHAPRVAESAGQQPYDPVTVFYPRGDCATGVLEIELFNRVVGKWRPHPAHPRILADTCQVEDAGDLLNEIRVRCTDPGNPARASEWKTGVQVYQPASAPGCVSPQLQVVAPKRSPRILLTKPPANEPVRTTTSTADVVGRVLLTHDLLVLVDSSFPDEIRPSVRKALEQIVQRDAPMLGPLRMAVLGFGAEPAGDGGGASMAMSLSDDRAEIESAIRAALDSGRARPKGGFAAALDDGLSALSDPRRAGDRRTLVALVNGDAGYPFGGSAGSDPAQRKAVLAAVDRTLHAGISLQVFAIGRRERDLAELVDQLRERIEQSGLEGGMTVVEEADGLAGLLPELPILTLRDIRVENLANGVLAEPLGWERGGRFDGTVRMDSGRNLLRVRAKLSDGKEVVADFERSFDPTALREKLREEERARIERARREAEAREGNVTIDVEE